MRIKVNLDQMAVDIKNIRYYLGLSQYYRLSVSIFLHPPRRKVQNDKSPRIKLEGEKITTQHERPGHSSFFQ